MICNFVLVYVTLYGIIIMLVCNSFCPALKVMSDNLRLNQNLAVSFIIEPPLCVS